jgi:hypothetical protein
MTRDVRNTIVISLIAFALGCGLSAICLALCGPSLALIFSGFFILTPILPAIVLAQSRRIDRLIVSVITILGPALIWTRALNSSQCWACLAMLIAYAILLGGLAVLLLRIRFGTLFANAIVTITGLAWLSWPLWLVPNLPEARVDPTVNILVRFHPLFAVNGILANFGDWAHWPIAYRDLTTLGQDIPFSLPTSIVPAFALHAFAGIAMILLSALGRRSPATSRPAGAAQS